MNGQPSLPKGEDVVMDLLTLSGPQPLWNVSRVAGFFGVSENWVYRMVEANLIPHVRLGGNIRFHYTELVDWFNAQRAGPGGGAR